MDKKLDEKIKNTKATILNVLIVLGVAFVLLHFFQLISENLYRPEYITAEELERCPIRCCTFCPENSTKPQCHPEATINCLCTTNAEALHKQSDCIRYYRGHGD